jgi:hypothetical protein
MPPACPSVDESLDRLRRAGWSVGDTVNASGWLVTGTNGENRIHAEGRTRAEAWWNACVQAREVGLLAPALERAEAHAGPSALVSPTRRTLTEVRSASDGTEATGGRSGARPGAAATPPPRAQRWRRTKA